ncbi:hypothetical protein [Sandaracinus amylolyticus]|uniref:Glycosyltransferase RgtA/B/C/D-like domain-containing protein n=1 Tax=Sandaracinus amylolyticus TaxID=927083 RepID=A0A0F6YJB3_9BACT|nr:hypothetical protein [Sandaracinus amylolyticus]AKF07860.1 hypothetical protein DB32_005009 [Sandaracinus amylolyticus]
MRDTSTPTVVIGAVLASAATITWLALVAAYWTFTVDDTFILLRYADHVARGIGPTWNVDGPPAEGYTSPLWVAVLAIARGFGATSVLAPKVLGVLAMGAAIALVARLAWRVAERTERGAVAIEVQPALASGCAAFVMAAWPATAIHSVSGMETALATCLVAAYALALVETLETRTAARAATAAALGLAASLARPELNLFVALASLLALTRLDGPGRARFALSVLALHVIPGAIYFAWRVRYYGLWLPLPFYVKAALPGTTFAGVDEALGFARALLVERIDVGIAVAVGVVGARRSLAPLALAALAVWLFFFVPAHEMGFDHRYPFPIVPVLAACAGVGVARIAGWLRAPSGRAWSPAAMASIVAVSAFASSAPHLAGSLAEKRDYGAGIERAHARIGRALHELGGAIDRPVIAALDVGAIAYFSQWTVIDTWGLNEPRVARTGRRDAEPVLAESPSVVIVVSSRADRFAPHFEHEQALWDGAHARGMAQVARFEFLPDYQLLALATPGSPVASALEAASSTRASALASAEPPSARAP